MASNSAQHWNGCQAVVMDVETTGLDAHFNEIIQFAAVPLDANLEIRKDVMPLCMKLKPDHPERASKEAMRVNGQNLADLARTGHDQQKGADLLGEWIDRLGLPMNKGGYNRCKIIPLGQNFAFDRNFLQQWIGPEQYHEWFHFHFRDTMILALGMNDRASFRCEPVPFPKVNLTYLASQLGIENSGAHDALQDCRMTAEIYKTLVTQTGTTLV